MKRWLIVVVLLLASLMSAAAQDGGGVWLPLILKGQNEMDCQPFQILELQTRDTDGNLERVNLLSPKSGFCLLDWRPAVTEPKGGGVWRDSQLADGRRLAMHKRANVIETYSLAVRNWTPDDLIRDTQDLRRMLEKARAYSTARWQNNPVWVKRQGMIEAAPTYSIIYDYRTPQDGNPHGSDAFWTALGISAFDSFTLIVEREPWWRGDEPGTGTCVEASNVQSWTYEGEWLFNTTIAIDDVWAIIQADNGYLFAGEDRIDRSIDNGATWAMNFAGLNSSCRALLQAANGDIYAADNAAIWRTQNYGGAWALNHNPGAIQLYSLAQQAHNEYLYCGGNQIILRSINNGGAWGVTNIAGHNFESLLAASNGYVFAGSFHQTNPSIFRSTDDGATWQLNTSLPAHNVTSMAEVDGRILAVAQGAMYTQRIIATDDWGENWYVIAIEQDFELGLTGTGPIPYRLLTAADGSVYATGSETIGTRPVVVWRSQNRGDSWDRLVELTGGVGTTGKGVGQATYTDDRVYVGSIDVANDEIWRTGLATDMGRAATCENEVYVPNKENTANLTHIKVFDFGAVPPADYTDIGIPMTLPATLLPAGPAVNDAVYFCIDSTVIPSGPFCSLVFDIETPATSTSSYTIDWEYWNGGWVALAVTDNTDQGSGVFSQFGVNSVHWVPPSDWLTTTVDLVTGWWVRAVVSALVGVLTPPVQERRNIYSVVRAGIDVDDAQVLGDIPALLQFKFYNRSDEDGYSTVNQLDLLENRVVFGLRSLDRGSTFTAYLNCSDEQNPPGVTAANGAATSDVNDIDHPTGRSMQHTTTGASTWTDECVFTLSPTVARDFFGSFHAYLRAQEVDRSAVMDEVRVRLQVRTGSGGVTSTTEHKPFCNLNDWQLLDFGGLNLPASGLLSSTDLPDEMEIAVQIWSSVAALTVNLYDLILIPTDEWALDLVDKALEDDSGVTNGYLLDVDSVIYPKQNIRVMVRQAGSERVRSTYQPNGPSPAILQANADQRLWFLAARGCVTGTHTGGNNQPVLTDANASFLISGVEAGQYIYNLTDTTWGIITAVTATTVTATTLAGAAFDWDTNESYLIICPNWRSEPWNCHSVQLVNVARYLSMKGAR